MNKKIEEFLNILYDQVGRGIYVWGGNGELLEKMSDPYDWIRRHESDPKNAERSIKLYKERIGKGISDIRAFDCSGLVYYTLKKIGLQDSDVSSRGLYDLCEHKTKKELIKSDLVFHHDGKQIVHVGVYVGDGLYIECRGRDVGVVLNKRSAGYWNRFGEFKKFKKYEEPDPPSPLVPCFFRVLKYGCSGEDVIELKKLLISFGFSKGITVDTKNSKRFGSSTKKMVKEFQKSRSLKADGIAGRDTITALGARFV